MKLKINIYDIIAVLLVLGLCLATYIKFGVLEHTKTDAQMSKIEYSIQFLGLRKYSVDTFKSGDTVYDSQTKTEIGTIKEVIAEPDKFIAETSKGEVIIANSPEKYDVTLIIDTEGLDNEKGYFANKSVELKVGSEKYIETLYIKSSGTIKSIKVIE